MTSADDEDLINTAEVAQMLVERKGWNPDQKRLRNNAGEWLRDQGVPEVPRVGKEKKFRRVDVQHALDNPKPMGRPPKRRSRDDG